MNLFMVLLGGKPDGRYTEQHDIFFGVADELKELVPAFYSFWPELTDRMHIDSWRYVSKVGEFSISILPKSEYDKTKSTKKLFFVNLGGYKEEDMEEYHYKQLVVAESLAEATRLAKDTVFWKHHTSSHIDDKYGIDVDDIYEIEDMLLPEFKDQFTIKIEEAVSTKEDVLEIGYLKISKLLKS